jgi:hypothetical protein
MTLKLVYCCLKNASLIKCNPTITASLSRLFFAKDTKEVYQVEYKAFFPFLQENAIEKNSNDIIFPQDMSSVWKTIGYGRMAKVKTFPCYCYAVTMAILVTPHPKKNSSNMSNAGSQSAITTRCIHICSSCLLI